MLKQLFANKRGLFTGSIVAILIICYDIFLSESHSHWTQRLSSTGDIAWNLIIILGGAISGFAIENFFIPRFQKSGSVIGCIIGSIVASPLSYYLGIIFGSLLGAYFHDILIIIFGLWLKEVVTFLGMLIGISAIILAIESIGAIIGSFGGFIVESLIKGPPVESKKER